MKQVPTTWTQTKFIEGYPGKYCVIARKSGDKWYIAGNNAEKETKSLVLDLTGFVAPFDRVALYSDKPDREPQKTELVIKNPKKVKIDILHDGGFVIVR